MFCFYCNILLCLFLFTQALLDMYLVDTVPVVTKHCIVGYFLLDVLYVSKLSGTQKEEVKKNTFFFGGGGLCLASPSSERPIWLQPYYLEIQICIIHQCSSG